MIHQNTQQSTAVLCPSALQFWQSGHLTSGLIWLVWMNIFQIAPKSSRNMQFRSKSDHRWLLQSFHYFSNFTVSGLYLKHFFSIFGQGWALGTGYGPGIDLISFRQSGHLTSEVNFGLWPLLVGLIEDFSKSTLSIHEIFSSNQF